MYSENINNIINKPPTDQENYVLKAHPFNNFLQAKTTSVSMDIKYKRRNNCF